MAPEGLMDDVILSETCWNDGHMPYTHLGAAALQILAELLIHSMSPNPHMRAQLR